MSSATKFDLESSTHGWETMCKPAYCVYRGKYTGQASLTMRNKGTDFILWMLGPLVIKNKLQYLVWVLVIEEQGLARKFQGEK